MTYGYIILYTGDIMLTGNADCQYPSKCDCKRYSSNISYRINNYIQVCLHVSACVN